MTTILVVDDSPVDREVAGGFVREAGCEATFATQGAHALQLIVESPPDLVLTDLNMPEMDGLHLVQEMRALHPTIPVILMTAQGSEEIAVEALHAGAAHYVPKPNLARDLDKAIQTVLSSVQADRERDQVRKFLREQETYYILGYEPGGTRSLIGHLQDSLLHMRICPRSDLVRVGTALTEALDNAVEHGNLELDSSLREESFNAYWTEGRRRQAIAPYRDRRVHVRVNLVPGAATFVILDEGNGFDVASLPDPRDPENVTKASGRGVMLLRTFMDEVRYNTRGNEVTLVMRAEGRM
jgi:CheY-like chemotaxis protein/anti-sigma regulatory factor (Ser/Thr protein kinase)